MEVEIRRWTTPAGIEVIRTTEPVDEADALAGHEITIRALNERGRGCCGHAVISNVIALAARPARQESGA